MQIHSKFTFLRVPRGHTWICNIKSTSENKITIIIFLHKHNFVLVVTVSEIFSKFHTILKRNFVGLFLNFSLPFFKSIIGINCIQIKGKCIQHIINKNVKFTTTVYVFLIEIKKNIFFYVSTWIFTTKSTSYSPFRAGCGTWSSAL